MSIDQLIAQYEAAKNTMLEGYRGMHKAPHFLTWNEVQDLQDKMQSAAVELAEHMLTACSTSAAPQEDEAQPLPSIDHVNVTEVERDSFYSGTSKSHRAMWRLRTTDGRQVNVFDHSDPLRDSKPLLKASGYLELFEAMSEGNTEHWDTYPIQVKLIADGSFWKVVRINPRAADACPDAPVTPADIFGDEGISLPSFGVLTDPSFLLDDDDDDAESEGE